MNTPETIRVSNNSSFEMDIYEYPNQQRKGMKYGAVKVTVTNITAKSLDASIEFLYGRFKGQKYICNNVTPSGTSAKANSRYVNLILTDKLPDLYKRLAIGPFKEVDPMDGNAIITNFHCWMD